MKKTDRQALRKMGINNKPLRDLLVAEGLMGVGALSYLNDLLRHSQNYRIRLSLLSGIALDTHTSVRYLLKIIKNYGLFVIDGDEFYSPEITNLMLRMKIKHFQIRENELQKNSPIKKSLSVATELNEVKKKLSITIKELNNCKIASLHACAKINTISQLRLREREKEKRETACGEIQKTQLAARKISQQATEEGETEVLNQAEELNQRNGAASENDPNAGNHPNTGNHPNAGNDLNLENELAPVGDLNQAGELNQAEKIKQADHQAGNQLSRDHSSGIDHSATVDHSSGVDHLATGDHSRRVMHSGRIDYSGGEVNVNQAAKTLQENGPLPIKNALQRCGEVKLWSDWADVMEQDDAYMERIAMHSRMGKRFITARKRVVELFKEHVETYSTSSGLFTLNDVKYYFASFMKPESLTWKWVNEKLREEEEARQVVDPYRFEMRVNGVRMYPGGGIIPDDATPRPSKYAVWSEVSQRWVGK